MYTLSKADIFRAALIGEVSLLLMLLTARLSSDALASLPINGFALSISLIVAVPFATVALLYGARAYSKHLPSAIQIVKFALVGVLNTLVDLGIFTLLSTIVLTQSYLLLSLFKIVAFVLALSNSYIWNKFWVFREGEAVKASLKELFSFTLISLWGLIVNAASFASALFLFSYSELFSFRIELIIAVLIASATSMLWNFVGYKFVVFKNHE